jgi:hypothetical protein
VFTQQLDVAADPRVPLPPATYGEQFTLAREIEAARARVAAAEADAARLQTALIARRALAPRMASHLDAFQEALTAITGLRQTGPQPESWRPPRALTTLRYLTMTLMALQQAVDGADAAPTPDARAGFTAIKALIAPVLARWDELRTRDLAALNATLSRLGEAPLTPSH